MTTHLEQLHNRLKASCPEIAENPQYLEITHYRSMFTTTEKLFLVAEVPTWNFLIIQSSINTNARKRPINLLFEEHLLSFIKRLYEKKLDEPLIKLTKYYQKFLTFLWCWKDFHKDKKFKWPIVVNPNKSTKQFYNTFGGNHRLLVVHTYNMIFDVNYTVESICEKHFEPFKGNLYDKQITKFLSARNTSISIDTPYPIVNGHRCFVSSNKHEEFYTLLNIANSSDWPDLIFDDVTTKQLNSIFNTDVFQSGPDYIDLRLKAPLFRFIEIYTIINKRDTVGVMLCGIFSCIFLKIPVESRYFSLKFQK